MDITALQKMIASDVAAVRTPLIVIGDVGASICGHVDNIQRLQEVCRANSIWLHCRGHSLAALAVTQGALLPRSDGQPFTSIADSLSLTLGNWLALPNLPVVVSADDAFMRDDAEFRMIHSIVDFQLLHRQIENVSLALIDADPVLSRRLTALSLWTSLQAFGRDSIAGRITVAFECCRLFHEIVSKCDGLRVLVSHFEIKIKSRAMVPFSLIAFIFRVKHLVAIPMRRLPI